MAIRPTEYIWHNGKLVRWADATVHVLAHALHYGSSVFEGIRVYATPSGPRWFRLREHVDRLYRSAKIYRYSIPFSPAEFTAGCHAVVRENGLAAAYVRPIVYLGYGGIGINPVGAPVEVAIAAVEWGHYLGAEGLEQGIDACVSSWHRLAPNTIPALAKAGGNYLSSQLIHTEARRHGYTEGIGLCPDGTVSEGSGENLFVVRDGTVVTTGATSSILEGITRASVLAICADLGIPTREQAIPRELLYLADEVFMTGTAAEITPVRSIDRIAVGDGKPGPITQRIQAAFFGLFDGRESDRHGWLTPLAAAT